MGGAPWARRGLGRGKSINGQTARGPALFVHFHASCPLLCVPARLSLAPLRTHPLPTPGPAAHKPAPLCFPDPSDLRLVSSPAVIRHPPPGSPAVSLPEVFLCVPSRFGRVRPSATPWNGAHQAPLSTGFSRQEYTGVGCHSLLQGNLPNPGIEPMSLMSPAFAGELFSTNAIWEARGV